MKIMKIVFLIIVTATLFFSCDNDSSSSPNDTQCNFDGLTFLDTSSNVQTLIAETLLTTDFFPNNGGAGIPGVEIFGTATTGEFVVFVTDVVTLNATGPGSISVNGTNYPVTVTCQRAGTAVGDEFRFDLVGSGAEAEYCVVIDSVNP